MSSGEGLLWELLGGRKHAGATRGWCCNKTGVSVIVRWRGCVDPCFLVLLEELRGGQAEEHGRLLECGAGGQGNDIVLPAFIHLQHTAFIHLQHSHYHPFHLIYCTM